MGHAVQLVYSQTVHISHEYHYACGLWSCNGLQCCRQHIPAQYNALLGEAPLSLQHKSPSFVGYKFSRRYIHIDNYMPFISCDYFLQPDQNTLYVPLGQGSATFLPFLACARRGLGTRLGLMKIVQMRGTHSYHIVLVLAFKLVNTDMLVMLLTVPPDHLCMNNLSPWTIHACYKQSPPSSLNSRIVCSWNGQSP